MLENEANIENNSSNHKIASLIHLALNLASTKTIIRKEDIMKYGIPVLIRETNTVLKKFFGLCLIPLPQYISNSIFSATQASSTYADKQNVLSKSFNDTNISLNPLKNFDSYLLIRDQSIIKKWNLQTSMSSLLGHRAEYTCLLMCLLCIIRLSDMGQLKYQSLKQFLKIIDQQFEFEKSCEKCHPLINSNFDGWLHQLVLQRYIIRAKKNDQIISSVTNSMLTDEFIYGLGPRTIEEFPDSHMMIFIKHILAFIQKEKNHLSIPEIHNFTTSILTDAIIEQSFSK